jgi:hypothetical protein
MKSDQENNNNIDLDTILNSLSSNLIIVRSYIIYCFFINIYKEINVPLNQDGKVEIIVADINFTVRNNTSRYINGLQIGYNYKGSSYTIFTASTIGVSEERSGHVTVPPRTPITWFAIGNNTSLNISPSSGNYNGGVVTTINFSIY